MILNNSHSREYLIDYKNGKIAKGLAIDCEELDNRLRFKRGQLNMVNGLDNVGKTAWLLWYFLCLSVKHNLSWCIWSGENKASMLIRQLIEMYSGKKIREMEEKEIYKFDTEINNWFKFVDNAKIYTNKELYLLFKESECDGALIDPYTGMKRGYSHEDNYNFLNESRQFVNSTGITLYVNTHPNTEAARRKHNGGQYDGYQQAPMRSESEGGQAFANRVDDFITIHRYVGHPEMKYKTMIFTRKIKDTETGGEVCAIDDPVVFDWNNGRGFTCRSANPLLSQQPKKEVNNIVFSEPSNNSPF